MKKLFFIIPAMLLCVCLFGCAAAPKTPVATDNVSSSYIKECPVSITNFSFTGDSSFGADFTNKGSKAIKDIEYIVFSYNKTGSSLDEPGSFTSGTLSGAAESGKALQLTNGASKKDAAYAVIIVTKATYQDGTVWDNPYQNIQGKKSELSKLYFCKKIAIDDVLVLPSK